MQLAKLTDLSPDLAEPRPAPVSRPVWVLFALIALLTVSALIWATITEVDKVVIAKGKTITVGGLLLIQPLNRAIIKNIHIHEGDVVAEGDALIVLDPTLTSADLDQLRSRTESLTAEMARLEAEMDGRLFQTSTDNPSPHESVQAELYAARQAAYSSKLDEYDEELKGMKAAATKSKHASEGLALRLEVHTEIERMHNKLLRSTKDTSKLLWLQAQDTRLGIEFELQGERDQLESVQHSIKATLAKKIEFETEWRSEVVDALVSRRREYEEVLQKRLKAELESRLVTLVAVAPAVVLEIADVSVGSVVKEAETLIRLVPQHTEIEVEAEARGEDIAYLETGQTVSVKLDSLPYVKHGTLEGTVRRISADSFQSESNNGQSSLRYVIRISIDRVDLKEVPEGFDILPGMPLTAEINVGQRTIMEYILHPLLRGLRESAREP